MKKLIIFLLALPLMGFGQRLSDLPAADTTGTGDIYVTVQGGITKKIPFDSLSYYIAKNYTYWTASGNDITNRNSGKVTITDSLYINDLKQADKTFWVMHWNQTTKRVEKMTPESLSDTINNVVDDHFYNLVYWKKDIINAYYIPTDNAKMGFLGDSYTHTYADYFKKESLSIYGYGGGYENLEGSAAYADYGTYKYVVSGWNYVSIPGDPYVIHSRAARSLGTNYVLRLGNLEYNRVKIHYRKRAAGGSFEIKCGTSGTPATVNTAGVNGDGWYVKNYGNVTLGQYDTIFITSKSSDTIDIYGFQFEMIPYNESLPNFEAQNKRLEVSILGDGGANISTFYTGKDTATLRKTLDTLDLSLLCFVNLDDQAGVASELNTLIDLFRTLRPEMDICILSAHEDKNGFGDATKGIMQTVARENNAAFINVNNSVGSLTNLVGSGSILADSIHLTAHGPYFPYFAIQNKILPMPTKQGAFSAYSLKIMGDRAIVKPNGTNYFWTSSQLKSTYSGDNNNAIGYLSGSKLTTASANTFYGSTAGQNTTTGSSNTFIGAGSGTANAGAGTNTGVGFNSLVANATGESNTAIGAYSLYANTNRTGLTAIGYFAGCHSTGTNTVAIGYNALKGVSGQSTGSFNTAIGFESLLGNTTGTSNTAVGLYTLKANTTGGYNMAFGREALYSNVSGSANVGIGFNAGYSSTGDYNIFIGYQAGYSETGSNKLYIDNSNTATPLIHGDFNTNQLWLNGKVQVGGTEASNTNDLFVDGTFTSMNSFGELYEDTDNTIAVIGTYRTITGLLAGDYQNVTLGDSSITVTQAGTYLINYSSTFTHAVNNTLCHISLFVNGTEDTSLEAERKIGTAGDVGSMSGTGFVALPANAVIKLRTLATNNGNITISHLNFNVSRIK